MRTTTDMIVIGMCIIAFVFLTKTEAFCIASLKYQDQGSECVYRDHKFESGTTYKAPAPYCVHCTCDNGDMSCCGWVVEVLNCEL
ncbi:hypothetical protein DPMN_062282 [Dreissena polymorpha]|uniref:Uncharacterized protein n=1 Tax=Dreissena polymorpha TaxID=45954 RepID=A0A9D4HI06_DREPO|nr:hypothetical protein DPMN_062282 [Dreissena polymorpha]